MTDYESMKNILKNELKICTQAHQIESVRSTISSTREQIEAILSEYKKLEEMAQWKRESVCEHAWEWVIGYDERYRYCNKCKCEE